MGLSKPRVPELDRRASVFGAISCPHSPGLWPQPLGRSSRGIRPETSAQVPPRAALCPRIQGCFRAPGSLHQFSFQNRLAPTDRYIPSLEASPSMAPLLPPDALLLPDPTLAEGEAPIPLTFNPAPKGRLSSSPRLLDARHLDLPGPLGPDTGWLPAEPDRRRGLGWSQGSHRGRGCGPRRDRSVAYGGVGSGSPEPGSVLPSLQHSPPPPRPIHCGRAGAQPDLALSPIARQTSRREAPGPT